MAAEDRGRRTRQCSTRLDRNSPLRKTNDEDKRTSIGRSGLLLQEKLELVDSKPDELFHAGLGADSKGVPVRESGRVNSRHDGSDSLAVDGLGLGESGGT